MIRYRKKPADVEAWQVGSDEPMPEWMTVQKRSFGMIFLEEKSWPLFKGDWVVRDEFGHIDVVPNDIFEHTYEVVE